ncbi:MAG: DUF2167 domain-containing protein [Deltaproteobacteria bacterium]|nr:DUF2167 domain-containing protein [Deltaproteobacteria bacterium]
MTRSVGGVSAGLLLSLMLPLSLAHAASEEAAADPLEGLPPEQAAAVKKVMALDASLKRQTGKVELQGGIATLTLPETYVYLNPADTEKVLVEWGNPPGSQSLGMLYPKESGLWGERSWAVIVSFSEEGYVKDDDAESINYDELLADMKKSNAESNEEREKNGYGRLDLVGWAERPHYDKASHKLYWAKELAAPGAAEHTLNYAIRALGRKGVLEMNAVAGTSQLEAIKTEMKNVLGFVEFKQGHQYADYTPGVDKLAAYGIGALIAGKVALKVGLFKGLLVALLAAKKLLVAGAVALFAAVRAFLRKRGSAAPAPVAVASAPPVTGPDQ